MQRSGTDFEKEKSVSYDNASKSGFDFDGEKQEAASHRDIPDKLDRAQTGADFISLNSCRLNYFAKPKV